MVAPRGRCRRRRRPAAPLAAIATLLLASLLHVRAAEDNRTVADLMQRVLRMEHKLDSRLGQHRAAPRFPPETPEPQQTALGFASTEISAAVIVGRGPSSLVVRQCATDERVSEPGDVCLWRKPTYVVSINNAARLIPGKTDLMVFNDVEAVQTLYRQDNTSFLPHRVNSILAPTAPHYKNGQSAIPSAKFARILHGYGFEGNVFHYNVWATYERLDKKLRPFSDRVPINRVVSSGHTALYWLAENGFQAVDVFGIGGMGYHPTLGKPAPAGTPVQRGRIRQVVPIWTEFHWWRFHGLRGRYAEGGLTLLPKHVRVFVDGCCHPITPETPYCKPDCPNLLLDYEYAVHTDGLNSLLSCLFNVRDTCATLRAKALN